LQASILVSDRQTIARKGIISILRDTLAQGSESHFTLNENSEPGLLLEKAQQIQPGLVITDYLQHQESINVLKVLKKSLQDIKLLVISQDTEIANIKQAIKWGIDGYLTRQCESEEMVNAVQMILKGKRFFCPSITERLLDYDRKHTEKERVLSKRELEILALIAKGNTTNQIAEILFISVHTVNSHRKNMLKKLGLKSPIELVTYAMDNGLV